MAWWLWALLSMMLAAGSVFAAVLCLSAGTALGHDYHSLSPRQRFMGKAVYRLAMLAVPLLALAGLGAAWLALRPWLA